MYTSMSAVSRAPDLRSAFLNWLKQQPAMQGAVSSADEVRWRVPPIYIGETLRLSETAWHTVFQMLRILEEYTQDDSTHSGPPRVFFDRESGRLRQGVKIYRKRIGDGAEFKLLKMDSDFSVVEGDEFILRLNSEPKAKPAPPASTAPAGGNVSLDRYRSIQAVERFLNGVPILRNFPHAVRVIRKIAISISEQAEFWVPGTLLGLIGRPDGSVLYDRVLYLATLPALGLYAMFFARQHRAPAWAQALAGASLITSVWSYAADLAHPGLVFWLLAGLQIIFGLAHLDRYQRQLDLSLVECIFQRSPGLDVRTPSETLVGLLSRLSRFPISPAGVMNLRLAINRLRAMDREFMDLVRELDHANQPTDPGEAAETTRRLSAEFSAWLGRMTAVLESISASDAWNLLPNCGIGQALRDRIADQITTDRDAALAVCRTVQQLRHEPSGSILRPQAPIAVPSRAPIIVQGPSDRFERYRGANRIVDELPMVPMNRIPGVPLPVLRQVMSLITTAMAPPGSPEGAPDRDLIDYRVQPARLYNIMPAMDIVLQFVVEGPTNEALLRQGGNFGLADLLVRRYGGQILLQRPDAPVEDPAVIRTLVTNGDADGYRAEEVVIRVPATPAAWRNARFGIERMFSAFRDRPSVFALRLLRRIRRALWYAVAVPIITILLFVQAFITTSRQEPSPLAPAIVPMRNHPVLIMRRTWPYSVGRLARFLAYGRFGAQRIPSLVADMLADNPDAPAYPSILVRGHYAPLDYKTEAEIEYRLGVDGVNHRTDRLRERIHEQESKPIASRARVLQMIEDLRRTYDRWGVTVQGAFFGPWRPGFRTHAGRPFGLMAATFSVMPATLPPVAEVI
ncbi:MAG TPA: hypothetical protein VMU17_04705, partial [Elusimicrobiota bacterium]|nr:hypothetical protein [Elusimicrobiota bacterium]